MIRFMVQINPFSPSKLHHKALKFVLEARMSIQDESHVWVGYLLYVEMFFKMYVF